MANQQHNHIPIAKIQQKTVVAQAMEQIRQLIASGHYQVHDKIPTEAELAQMFGIGRSSIREALKIFNYLGVLESQAAKGTFVSEQTNISVEALTWSILLGKKDLFELLEVRGAIELWSIFDLQKRYAENSDSIKDCLVTLGNLLVTMKEAINNSSFEVYDRADFDFHNTLVKGSGNSLFFAIYQTLRAFMHEAITKTHQYGRDISETYEEHKKFVEIIKSGDSAEAVLLGQAHFNSPKRSLGKLFNKKTALHRNQPI
ncbi:MAG: FadR family transcriptional regulator [bacterium]|nr:FadR family transcriptional regulator [bacterium]